MRPDKQRCSAAWVGHLGFAVFTCLACRCPKYTCTCGSLIHVYELGSGALIIEVTRATAMHLIAEAHLACGPARFFFPQRSKLSAQLLFFLLFPLILFLLCFSSSEFTIKKVLQSSAATRFLRGGAIRQRTGGSVRDGSKVSASARRPSTGEGFCAGAFK